MSTTASAGVYRVSSAVRDPELERYFNGGATPGTSHSLTAPRMHAHEASIEAGRSRKRWLIGGSIAAGLVVLGSAAGSARHLMAAAH